MDAIYDDRGKGCSHQGQPAPTSVNICNIKMSNITVNNGGSFTIAFNQGKKQPVVATETAADGDDGDGAADAAPPGKKAAANSPKRKNLSKAVPGADAPGESPVARVPFINEVEETRQMTMKRARKQGNQQQFCQACLSNQCQ